MRRFLLLLLTLSIPFWILGGLVDAPEAAPMGLPTSALMFVCPGLAAVILTGLDEGRAGLRQLLGRLLDVRRIRPGWWVPTLLLVPALGVLAAVLSGQSTTLPELSPLTLIVLAAAFLLASACEELGWTAYALPRLTRPGSRLRLGAVGSGVLLGVVWGCWHLIPLVQAGHQAPWIAGWFLGTVASRVIIVQLYFRTGRCVFSAVAYHGLLNLTGSLLTASRPDEMLTLGCVTAVTAAAFGWWPAGPGRPGQT